MRQYFLVTTEKHHENQLLFNNKTIRERDAEKTGMLMNHAAGGNIVGMEMLHASKHVKNLKSIEYTLVN